MNLIKWIKSLRKDETSETQLLIATDRALADHIIALARLMPLKPERLVEEAKNVQANAEYLTKMAESSKSVKTD